MAAAKGHHGVRLRINSGCHDKKVACAGFQHQPVVGAHGKGEAQSHHIRPLNEATDRFAVKHCSGAVCQADFGSGTSRSKHCHAKKGGSFEYVEADAAPCRYREIIPSRRCSCRAEVAHRVNPAEIDSLHQQCAVACNRKIQGGALAQQLACEVIAPPGDHICRNSRCQADCRKAANRGVRNQRRGRNGHQLHLHGVAAGTAQVRDLYPVGAACGDCNGLGGFTGAPEVTGARILGIEGQRPSTLYYIRTEVHYRLGQNW